MDDRSERRDLDVVSLWPPRRTKSVCGNGQSSRALFCVIREGEREGEVENFFLANSVVLLKSRQRGKTKEANFFGCVLSTLLIHISSILECGWKCEAF